MSAEGDGRSAEEVRRTITDDRGIVAKGLDSSPTPSGVYGGCRCHPHSECLEHTYANASGMRLAQKEPLEASPASAANGNLADLIQSDCACSSGRQINVPARYEGSTIVDPYDHTAMVTNRYAGSKWECTMRCCHGRTIHALTVRGATSTKSVWAAIDAGDFGMRGIYRDTRYSGHQWS